MIELPLQLGSNYKTLKIATDEGFERIKEFKPNQILRAKLYGAKKPRSVVQLNLYWKCCEIVAENLEGYTKEDVDFEVKVKLRHIKAFKVIKGVTYIEVDSIAFRNLDHLEACNYFDRAFPVMAKMLKVPVDRLLERATENA